jgi:NAD-dependent deacetylase
VTHLDNPKPPVPPTAEAVSAVAAKIARCRSVVVFTGAGVSTESGIPDFRSPGGLWAKYRPIEFSDFLASEQARRESWLRRFAMSSALDHVRPNDGHRAISRGVSSGRVSAVITQNIDGLHQAAGVPDAQVIELHGNTLYGKCLDCETRYDLETLRTDFERDGTPPRCGRCGGHVKTATISFGQPMPEREMQRAEAVTLACDLFLAVGSSLVVYPAAGFPALARRNGAQLVILNREETPLDAIADCTIRAEAGVALPLLFPQ